MNKIISSKHAKDFICAYPWVYLKFSPLYNKAKLDL